jgi:hypothetical protein
VCKVFLFYGLGLVVDHLALGPCVYSSIAIPETIAVSLAYCTKLSATNCPLSHHFSSPPQSRQRQKSSSRSTRSE